MKKTVSTNMDVNLLIPIIPNYIRIDDGSGGDAFKTFHISELSEDILKQIGEQWTQNLIEAARKVRK